MPIGVGSRSNSDAFFAGMGHRSTWEELSASPHGSVHHHPTQVCYPRKSSSPEQVGCPTAPAYYVQVGGVGRARVALHPGRGARLHVDERGPQAIDVCFGRMAPAQDHLRAHVDLKEKEDGSVRLSSPV